MFLEFSVFFKKRILLCQLSSSIFLINVVFFVPLATSWHWTVSQTAILWTLKQFFGQTAEYRDSYYIWVNPSWQLHNISEKEQAINQCIFQFFPEKWWQKTSVSFYKLTLTKHVSFYSQQLDLLKKLLKSRLVKLFAKQP